MHARTRSAKLDEAHVFDVYLPLGSEVLVKMGQATVGNQTVIAKMPPTAKQR